MNMTAFRVENYRCITDSGWVEVNDSTAIVGKNEAGKTSLLKALWKFNPYHGEGYDLQREWPRGRRREMSPEKPVATVRFAFSPEECAQLAAIHDSLAGLTGVEIQRNYEGTYHYHFLPDDPDSPNNLKWVINVLKKHFNGTQNLAFGHVREGYQAVLDSFRHGRTETPMTVSGGGAATAVKTPEVLQANIRNAVAELSAKPPVRLAIEMVHKWLPTYVYMDDYKVFKGSAQLDQLQQRKLANKLSEEDRTILKIMEMAGLDLDEEVHKANQRDREQRILDMNDASQTLTEEIAHRWSQKRYEVMIQADGHHFIVFVKDSRTNILVPLDERSKGFQWFFSFDMTLMYETAGAFTNAVILLDEPGLHLHAAAQRDLLLRLRAYAAKNQLLYTTHLPFMIDCTRLENVRIAVEGDKEGAVIHSDWSKADPDARFTLQAALELSMSESIFSGQHHLIVEGVADFWLLDTLSALLADGGKEGLDERLTITPAGGANRVACVSAMLRGQRATVVVLDGGARTDTESRWTLDGGNLVRMDEVLGAEHPCTLEDLFDEEYYLAQVNHAYHGELAGVPLTLEPAPRLPLVRRVARALAARGITRFSKARVARRIMRDLAKKELADLPEQTTARFATLFSAVNTIIRRENNRQQN